MWTPEMVQEKLPNVQVKMIDGTIVDAIVRGRQGKFATVTWLAMGVNLGEWTWQAIANAMNGGRPLMM